MYFLIQSYNQTINDTEKNIFSACVYLYTFSEQIELENPGCSGNEANLEWFQMGIYSLMF